MFIVRGEDGGRIHETELQDYPPGHLYCVQPKAWMDRTRWDVYLVEMLAYVQSEMEPVLFLACLACKQNASISKNRPHLNENSVVLLDNFDAHVTPASHECVQSAYNLELIMLPPNCTHVCQPLDVGVMGPFKSILRSKWLIENVDELLDENGYLRPTTPDSDVSRKAPAKRLATIRRAIDAWAEISEECIRKSFEKAIPGRKNFATTIEVVV